MRTNHIQFGSPQFRVLSDKQMEELHLAAVQILERTGVTIDSEEAIGLLGDSGADVSNPKRVKIPYFLVEQALRTVPKNIILYTRDGQPSMFLNGTRTYFGGVIDCPWYLDPYTRSRRALYVEDAASNARVIDFLPNINWVFTGAGSPSLPAGLEDKVHFVQGILNSSKTICAGIYGKSNLKAMVEICSIIRGGSKELKAKPFFVATEEVITPLTHGRDALEKSLICAELGIPNVIYNTMMAGATCPATFAGALAMANAEILSHIVVTQLKNPGAPIIYGGQPNVMEMSTLTFCYGTPELNLHVAALCELSHLFYKLPFYGTAGTTDAESIGVQAGWELMFECLASALSGADFVHDTGLMGHCSMTSPELMVLHDEMVGMVNAFMGGIEISDETLALDLIDRVGPGGNYLTEAHTLKHFTKFWVPRLLDRTPLTPDQNESVNPCEERINKKAREIIETHTPVPLPGEIVKEIKKVEESWFKEAGVKFEYPKRPKIKSK